jgi:hypothetical protein
VAALTKSRVEAAIIVHAPLMLQSGPNLAASVGGVLRFQTAHTRPAGASINLRHALLSFNTPS